MKRNQEINNQNVFSIQTDLIKAIISRDEVVKYSMNNFKDLKIDENTVIISITDPGSKFISMDILNKFKDNLSIQFWDIEEQIGNYKPISIEQAKVIKDFVIKNKDNNFIVHCEAGMSRSAAVGLFIYYIIEHNEDRYSFQTSPNPIKEHQRYHPNWAVFDVISKI